MYNASMRGGLDSRNEMKQREAQQTPRVEAFVLVKNHSLKASSDHHCDFFSSSSMSSRWGLARCGAV